MKGHKCQVSEDRDEKAATQPISSIAATNIFSQALVWWLTGSSTERRFPPQGNLDRLQLVLGLRHLRDCDSTRHPSLEAR
jgi:hypothetical protein